MGMSRSMQYTDIPDGQGHTQKNYWVIELGNEITKKYKTHA